MLTRRIYVLYLRYIYSNRLNFFMRENLMNIINPIEDILTKKDLARILQISPRSVDTIVTRGLAGRPPHKIINIGRGVRVQPAALIDWLKKIAEPVAPRKRGRPRKYRAVSSAVKYTARSIWQAG